MSLYWKRLYVQSLTNKLMDVGELMNTYAKSARGDARFELLANTISYILVDFAAMLEELPPEEKPVLFWRIDELEIPERALVPLRRENIKHVLDLCLQSEHYVMKTRNNIGKKGLEEIKTALEKHGLSLGMFAGFLHR
ncbi:hypothetical protein EXS57_00985 [Candidatus Kaiserbacteria bacterium]|nr:hypothetical protein [Candidatus Kaiserbacteria bacterium]